MKKEKNEELICTLQDIHEIDKSIIFLKKVYVEAQNNNFLKGIKTKCVGELGELLVTKKLLTKFKNYYVVKRGGSAAYDLGLRSFNDSKKKDIRIEIKTKSDDHTLNSVYTNETKGIGWKIIGQSALEKEQIKFDYIVLVGLNIKGNIKRAYVLDYKNAIDYAFKEPSSRFKSVGKCLHIIESRLTPNIFSKNKKDTKLLKDLKKIKSNINKYKNNWNLIK